LVILRKTTVTVVGEVKAPGVYQMQDGARVLDALAAAGGLTQRSDRNVAKLVRAESANATINLKAAFSEPASDANAILHSGDTLIIQEAYNQVAVLGAVERPGTFYSPERLTAAQALALAGGPTDDADLEHVKRLRAGEQPRVVDLRPLVQTTRTSSLDQFSAGADAVVLERGDALIVPARFQRVMVLGAVRAPGAYPIQPGDRVTDALAAAGGHIVGKSRIERIALMRRDADRVIVHRIDLRRLVAGRDQSQDQLVSDGDIIVVPGAAKTRWRDYAWLVFGAASAARYAVEVFK
ncbi:MAG: SLBB domain-containing protein, partial [Armatimonadota bacterium]